MRKHKLIAGLLTAAMLVGLLPGALAAAPSDAPNRQCLNWVWISKRPLVP